MKKIIIRVVFIFIFIYIGIVCNNKSLGASASISSSAKNVEPGTTVTITGSVSNTEAWNLSLKSSGGTLTGTTSNTDAAGEEVSKQVISATFVANSEGKYTISLEGEVTGSDLVKQKVTGKSVEITVAKKEEVKVEAPKVTKSSDATLKNLGIKPYDFNNFKSGNTSYSVSVPYETSKIEVYAQKNDSKATVTGTGTKTLELGENKFNVKVTAEDGKTTKTYTITVNRAKISTVATLKNLGIKPHDFSNYKSSVTKYNISVPYDTEKIEIYAEKNNSKQTIAGIGEKKLNVGENTFDVKVTAEDGKTTKTYTLLINRKEEVIEEEPKEDKIKENEATNVQNVIGITKLEVIGATLTPKFSNNVYSYTVEITDEMKELELALDKSSDKINVEIAGNENFRLGENVVTILATNTENGKKSTYQIVVDVKQGKIDTTALNAIMTTAHSNLEKQKIIVYITVGLILILIIAYIIEKYRLQSKDDSDDEDSEETDTYIEDEIDEDDNKNEEEKGIEKTHTKGKRFK